MEGKQGLVNIFSAIIFFICVILGGFWAEGERDVDSSAGYLFGTMVGLAAQYIVRKIFKVDEETGLGEDTKASPKQMSIEEPQEDGSNTTERERSM